MTAPGSLMAPWEVEGRRLAPLLDGTSAVVVAANDPSIAVSVAIGVARAHAPHRRVAIADLIGESPAIESQLTGDDPHGIADSFLYGVSLNKIARPMQGTDHVFLMPSGTEPVAHQGVYGNDRWRRLAAGFHQVGALLIVVARPQVPGFADLCGFIGTLMPVGDTAFPTPPGIPLIAAPAAPPQPAAAREDPSSPPARESRARAREAAQKDEESRTRTRWVLLILLAAIAVAVGALWPLIAERLPAPLSALLRREQPVADSTAVVVPPTKMDTLPQVDSLRSDSAAADSAQQDSTASEVPASPPPAVMNPADSASASRYAVYFAAANTRAGAMPDPRVRALEAVALSPVMEGNEQWYRVTVGAAVSRTDAEALLSRLRTDKVIGSGSIVSVPFAFRVESNVTASLVPNRLAALATRGIIAYALLQSDGSRTIYTGAFESPLQATALADSLRAAGVAPVLVYRTGRGY
ncbi:SPOR domain-containing protein [Gemmatimonas sp.]|uniref:SPOR domain-containing protein n=1 Tax=Gemmatimonas sp. TaxID=1962908 RepID=UPI0027BAF5C9|nr:SPOR domain-containing protein [Gemmatimonas sp.]